MSEWEGSSSGPGFPATVGRALRSGIGRVPMGVRTVYVVVALVSSAWFGLGLAVGSPLVHDPSWLDWVVLVSEAILLGAIWPVSLGSVLLGMWKAGG